MFSILVVSMLVLPNGLLLLALQERSLHGGMIGSIICKV